MSKPKTPTEGMLEEVKRKYSYDRDRGRIINKDTSKEPKALIDYRYLGCNVKDENGKYRMLRVHHIIWFFEHGEWPNREVDHVDGDKLNNHYTNLRLCEARENVIYYNQKQRTSSKYIGVYYHKGKSIWRSHTKVNGKYKHIKESSSEETCARAYDDFLVKLGLDPVNFTLYSDSNK